MATLRPMPFTVQVHTQCGQLDSVRNHYILTGQTSKKLRARSRECDGTSRVRVSHHHEPQKWSAHEGISSNDHEMCAFTTPITTTAISQQGVGFVWPVIDWPPENDLRGTPSAKILPEDKSLSASSGTSPVAVGEVDEMASIIATNSTPQTLLKRNRHHQCPDVSLCPRPLNHNRQ